MAGKIITSGDSDISLITSKIRSLAPLSREEETDLLTLAQLGSEEAFNKLVLHNLKFVLSVAKTYQNKGILLSDLFHEGAMGLMEGIRRFSNDRDTKLITYAVFWIRKFMIDSFVKSRIVKISPNKIALLNKITGIEMKLEGEKERVPTDEEIEDELGHEIDRKEIEEVKWGAEKHEYIFSESCEEDFDICGDDGESILDNMDMKIIENEIKSLNQRDRGIIKSAFGFDGATYLTAMEKYGLSRSELKKEIDRILSGLRKKLKVD